MATGLKSGVLWGYVPEARKEIMLVAQQFSYITPAKSRWCRGWSNGRPCVRPAGWHYAAGSTKKPHAKSGDYCFWHLITKGIQGTRYDIARADRAEAKLKEQARVD
jgi:hypothetical protein